MTQQATSAPPSKEEIRAEIEATRAAFMTLLDSLSAEDWKKPTSNEAWRVGQLMWHIAWGEAFVPRGVANAKKGGGFYPPAGLFNLVNPWLTRLGSRGATPESVRAKYEEAHKAVLACLETIADEDWDKALTFVGRTESVRLMMHGPTRHFEEHRADILKGLGRA